MESMSSGKAAVWLKTNKQMERKTIREGKVLVSHSQRSTENVVVMLLVILRADFRKEVSI